MARYHEAMAKRMNRKGGIAYDPYNGTDHDRCPPSITASYGIVGRVGTTLIFEDAVVPILARDGGRSSGGVRVADLRVEQQVDSAHSDDEGGSPQIPDHDVRSRHRGDLG